MFRNDGIGEVKTLLRGGNFVIFGEALTDPRKGNANQVKKVYKESRKKVLLMVGPLREGGGKGLGH